MELQTLPERTTHRACSQDAFFALAGCLQPTNSTDRGCGSGPTSTYYHISLEGWTIGQGMLPVVGRSVVGGRCSSNGWRAEELKPKQAEGAEGAEGAW